MPAGDPLSETFARNSRRYCTQTDRVAQRRALTSRSALAETNRSRPLPETSAVSRTIGGVSTWLVAIVGGLIGSVFTALVGLGARLLAARHEIEAADRFVRDRDEDLASWVSDRNLALQRELASATEQMNKRNLLDSGERRGRGQRGREHDSEHDDGDDGRMLQQHATAGEIVDPPNRFARRRRRCAPLNYRRTWKIVRLASGFAPGG